MRPASVLQFLPLFVLGFMPFHAPAQSTALTVDLVLDETFFLPGEELPVGVRISNLSGRPVTFGKTNNWLSFFVESKRGEVVARRGPVPVEGEFTLESSKAGTKWWNIQPYFDFEQPGTYLVYAELRMPDWNQRMVSDPIQINLQGASKLWEIPFGVPPANGDTNAAPANPEIRRYALQTAMRLKEKKLYARVTDEAETHIIKVVMLDRYLSFSNPQQQLDAKSQLHVLFQTGGSTYTYCIVNPDGELVGRQRHEITPNSRPRLYKNPDGSIAILGGKRLPSFVDIPPWNPPPTASMVDTNPPPKTNAPSAADKKKSKSSKK